MLVCCVKPLLRSLVVCISEAESSNRKPSFADLDNIFGPEQAPPAGEDRGDAWVCFSEESPDRLQTQEPAPPLPTSPPPPESPAPPLSTLPLSPEQPAPPLLTSPPPKEEALPSLHSSTPPSEEPAAPPVSSGPHTPEEQNPPAFSTPSASTPPKELVSPTTSSPPPFESPTTAPAASAPKARTPPALTPADGPGTDPLPRPPVSQEGQSKVSDTNQPKESGGENVTSPNDTKQSSRSTPPPPPPPTYRTMVSSPIPGAGGSSSGE